VDREFINWGVIGCARIADWQVIPGMKKANNAKLYAIAGRNKERVDEFKDKYNFVKSYYSYDELLEDSNIDAVYIPLPNALHLEWVLKAAAKKKHILCEKPLGCNSDEINTMKEACEKNGVLLMEAFAYRHNLLTSKLKELLDQGIIGKLKLILANFTDMLTNKEDIRFVKDLGGGATYDLGSYCVNIIRYLAGSEPISVVAAGKICPDSGVDLSSFAILNFKDDLKGMFHCAFDSFYRSEYQIVGEEGIIDVPKGFNQEGDIDIIIKKKKHTEIITVSTPSGYMLEIEQLGRCILNGEKPLVTLIDTYSNAQVIDNILKLIV